MKMKSLYIKIALAASITPMVMHCALSNRFKSLVSLCGLGISGYVLYQQTRPVIPTDYTIHMMWINRELQQNQPYITSSLQHIDSVVQWSQKNPKAKVMFWFDSFVTTEESIKNTRALICTTNIKNKQRPANITLRNIRELEYVKQHPEAFSTKIPVYFRADLARIIAGVETVRTDQSAPCVYADFDITPLSAAELFDTTTLRKLKKHHFLMAHEYNLLGFENSFHIVAYDKNLLTALDLFVIKANIKRAKEFLTDKDAPFFKNNPSWEIHAIGFQENVYYSYPLMYAYFCQLNGWTKQDPKKLLDNSTENAKYLVLHSPALENLKNFPMPTKRVANPASTSLRKEAALQYCAS